MVRMDFDAGVNIVSAAVTFSWGEPRETTSASGKDTLSYRKIERLTVFPAGSTADSTASRDSTMEGQPTDPLDMNQPESEM
jgi:hypothetical protein